MFVPKNYTFDSLKELVHNTQQGLSDGWKNITDKARKDVKVVNKMARKALATEDGGKLRDGYVTTVRLNAGYDMFKVFQTDWVLIHKDCVNNVNKAGQVDQKLNTFIKDWQKYDSYLDEFQGNLKMIPDVITNIKAIQEQVKDIAEQANKVEDLLLEYEDACERFEQEKLKVDMKIKLSQLVETKHAEYTLKKSFWTGGDEGDVVRRNSVKKIGESAVNTEATKEREAVEKQKAYEDAFLDQMNQYIKYGEIEKPIAGSLESSESVAVEDISINENDLSTLKEFLGPEEFNLVVQAQASQSNKKKSIEEREGKTKDIQVDQDDIDLRKDDIHENGIDKDEALNKVLEMSNSEEVHASGSARDNSNTIVETSKNVESSLSSVVGSVVSNVEPNVNTDAESTASVAPKSNVSSVAESEVSAVVVSGIETAAESNTSNDVESSMGTNVEAGTSIEIESSMESELDIDTLSNEPQTCINSSTENETGELDIELKEVDKVVDGEILPNESNKLINTAAISEDEDHEFFDASS